MKEKDKELNDLKNIFDKIDEFDNIFGTTSPEALSPDRVDNEAEDDQALQVPNNRNKR